MISDGHMVFTADVAIAALRLDVDTLRAKLVQVTKERDEALKVLKAIHDYGRTGENSSDGYPREVVYDVFAYKRMVDSYREAAGKALPDAKGEE